MCVHTFDLALLLAAKYDLLRFMLVIDGYVFIAGNLVMNEHLSYVSDSRNHVSDDT
jgi:hypothetical protein